MKPTRRIETLFATAAILIAASCGGEDNAPEHGAEDDTQPVLDDVQEPNDPSSGGSVEDAEPPATPATGGSSSGGMPAATGGSSSGGTGGGDACDENPSAYLANLQVIFNECRQGDDVTCQGLNPWDQQCRVDFLEAEKECLGESWLCTEQDALESAQCQLLCDFDEEQACRSTLPLCNSYTQLWTDYDGGYTDCIRDVDIDIVCTPTYGSCTLHGDNDGCQASNYEALVNCAETETIPPVYEYADYADEYQSALECLATCHAEARDCFYAAVGGEDSQQYGDCSVDEYNGCADARNACTGPCYDLLP